MLPSPDPPSPSTCQGGDGDGWILSKTLFTFRKLHPASENAPIIHSREPTRIFQDLSRRKPGTVHTSSRRYSKKHGKLAWKGAQPNSAVTLKASGVAVGTPRGLRGEVPCAKITWGGGGSPPTPAAEAASTRALRTGASPRPAVWAHASLHPRCLLRAGFGGFISFPSVPSCLRGKRSKSFRARAKPKPLIYPYCQ